MAVWLPPPRGPARQVTLRSGLPGSEAGPLPGVSQSQLAARPAPAPLTGFTRRQSGKPGLQRWGADHVPAVSLELVLAGLVVGSCALRTFAA